MTSFGCGPDAFLTDEIKDILGRSGKALTLMKIDDINNVGSMRLRIRSLIESLMMNRASGEVNKEAKTTPIFTKEERKEKLFFLILLRSFLLSSVNFCAVRVMNPNRFR
jgi:predicted nucleotide-binding protein (sugar kinase/HSP70/actin superfamily)